MHDAARAYVASVLAGSHWGHVIDVGGRNVNGTVTDLFTLGRYECVDLHPGPGVTTVADCRTWQPEEPADLVLLLEVLEHTDDPKGVLAACMSYLAPGGRLVVTAAGPGRAVHSGVDGGPALYAGEHYANVEEADLARWLDGLDQVQLARNEAARDVYATGVKPG